MTEKHKKKIRKAMKGKMLKNIDMIAGWNKGIKCPQISETRKKLFREKGNVYGFKKGYIPWNKGLTKENSEGVKKISETNKGKIVWNKGIKIDRKKYPKMGHFQKHSEKTKKKFRNRPYVGGGNYANGNKLEDYFEEGLLNKNIKFEKHKIVENINVDFFLLPNKIIFCDGIYWHSFPETIERDIRQNKKLLTAGYKVFRFDDKEILSNREKCLSCL